MKKVLIGLGVMVCALVAYMCFNILTYGIPFPTNADREIYNRSMAEFAAEREARDLSEVGSLQEALELEEEAPGLVEVRARTQANENAQRYFISNVDASWLEDDSIKAFNRFADRVEKAMDCVNTPVGYKDRFDGKAVEFHGGDIDSVNWQAVGISYALCFGRLEKVLKLANTSEHTEDDPRWGDAVRRLQAYYQHVENQVNYWDEKNSEVIVTFE